MAATVYVYKFAKENGQGRKDFKKTKLFLDYRKKEQIQ